MSEPPSEVTLALLNSKIKSRFHLYCLLSQKYKLPSFTSRAITTNYLKSYIMFPCPIFRILRNEFHPPFIVTKHINATDLWKNVEKLLRQKNKPPTGLDEDKLPDFEWLVGVYFHLSPNDELNLFPKIQKHENLVSRNIDPE